MMGNASQLSEGSLLPACARRLHPLNITAEERSTLLDFQILIDSSLIALSSVRWLEHDNRRG